MVEAVASRYYKNLGWDWTDLGGWDEDQRREREHEESRVVILREFGAALDAIAPMVEKLLRDQREEIASMLNSYPNEYCQEVAAAILERGDE